MSCLRDLVGDRIKLFHLVFEDGIILEHVIRVVSPFAVEESSQKWFGPILGIATKEGRGNRGFLSRRYLFEHKVHIQLIYLVLKLIAIPVEHI